MFVLFSRGAARLDVSVRWEDGAEGVGLMRLRRGVERGGQHAGRFGNDWTCLKVRPSRLQAFERSIIEAEREDGARKRIAVREPSSNLLCARIGFPGGTSAF